MPFSPLDSDERQYCSPGFDLPVGNFARSEPYFYGYHSSYDNEDTLDFNAVIDAVDRLEEICYALEKNAVYINSQPNCEPFLTKYELYPTLVNRNVPEIDIKSVLWLLNQSNGKHDLVSIANRSGVDFQLLVETSERLLDVGLLSQAPK